MLAGFPPFDGENDVEVFASILAVRYDFPSPEWDEISSDGKDFVAAILLEDPAQRLTAAQCLAHPWIVNNVPVEMRVNKPFQPVQATPIASEADSSGGSEAKDAEASHEDDND